MSMYRTIDFSARPVVSGAKYWHSNIDQLYHPTSDFGCEKYDIVYSKGIINATKFYKILLKEWFNIVSANGCMIIDYRENYLLGWQDLEKELWHLFRGKYEIVSHGPVEDVAQISVAVLVQSLRDKSDVNCETSIQSMKNEGIYHRLVVKKTGTLLYQNDTIDSWTFGIVTNGKNDEQVENIINTIRKQSIPNYEILICGIYNGDVGDDCVYIPFCQRDDRGWITKKKNIICSTAQFENLCIVHDRISFDDGWYKGIKLWGNCFEVMAVPQLLEQSKERFGDWVCVKNFTVQNADDLYPFKGAYMEYRDWDKDVPGCAAVLIIKRNIFKKIMYDETLYWGEYDDILLHQDLYNNGYLLRMNPCAITLSRNKTVYDLRWKHCFNNQSLGNIYNINFLTKITFYLLHAFGIKRNSKLLNGIKNILKDRQNLKNHRHISGIK